ncbi:MAG: PASTA domain-containing protein [Desulfobacteraceae bacterium]|nr:PASTA domain-containing protein [Desulfobacteraceae bacterium]
MLKRILKIIFLLIIFMSTAGISTYLTIHLLIRSKDTVVVPDLQNKQIVYALELLTEMGLNTKVKGSEYSASVPKHYIIYQDPPSGSEIKKGRDVRLVLSKGARSVIIPNLVGMGAPQARILLEENGLVPGKISYISNGNYFRDEIMSHYPPSGKSVFRQSAIDLLISLGAAPMWIEMLDLIELNLNQAITKLESNNLALGNIRFAEDLTATMDTVTAHTPSAGYPVLPGSEIELTVNRRASSQAAKRRAKNQLFRYRLAAGFLNHSVRIQFKHKEYTLDLYHAFLKPNKEIWIAIPNQEPSTIFLYLDDELFSTKHFGALE